MAEEPSSYFDREARIVYLNLGTRQYAAATTEEKDWGLIDYDGEGELVGLEFFRPDEQLPKSLLDALPDLPPPHDEERRDG